MTGLCPGTEPCRLFCTPFPPSLCASLSVPSLTALEWFRLHFTCECCCFLNYGDRNTESERERSKPSRDSNLDCGLALRCVAATALCRTALRCAASFLELPLLTTVESVVFQRGSAWLCMGFGVRSRILFKTLPRNRIFDAAMSGYHKNASDNGQRPPHCPQCIQLWLLNQNTAQTQLQCQHRLLLLLLLLLTLLSCSCLLLLLPLLSYSRLQLLLLL